jgi:hypothetical protein
VLGLQAHALLVRLSRRSRDPKGYELRTHLRPERLNYVITAISQHVHVGEDGRVRAIETTQRIQALFSGVTTCVFAYADDETEQVKVTALSGCEANHWWPPIQRLKQVRIDLLGEPLQAGEVREFRYRVEHRYVGSGGVPLRPSERSHRGNGTPTLNRFEVRVSFPRPGFSVQRCVWLNRDTEPLTQDAWTLASRNSPLIAWDRTPELAYGVTWELPS